MKIGFQIEHLDPARGGAETYVHRFAQDLLAAGHEVHLRWQERVVLGDDVHLARVIRRARRDRRRGHGIGRAGSQQQADQKRNGNGRNAIAGQAVANRAHEPSLDGSPA